MIMPWETTVEDVQIVLDAHRHQYTDDQLLEIYKSLDLDAIVEGLLYFTSMEEQTDSMLEDIESQLMDKGILSGPKQFTMSDSYEEEE